MPIVAPSSEGLHSSCNSGRATRTGIGSFAWFRSQRLLYWLLVIALWSCLRLYAQPRWAHGGKKDDVMGSVDEPSHFINESFLTVKHESFVTAKHESTASRQRANGRSPNLLRKRYMRTVRHSRSRVERKKKAMAAMKSRNLEEKEMVTMKNASYGLIVGPFSSIEDKLLGSIAKKQSGTCDLKGDFGWAVKSRKFVLIFHELSMTGAPLSMMELATELLSCWATVSVVVLSKKGGLLRELTQRRIRVLEDRAELSFKAALQADLVIAGSAVCASWIGKQFLAIWPIKIEKIIMVNYILVFFLSFAFNMFTPFNFKHSRHRIMQPNL